MSQSMSANQSVVSNLNAPGQMGRSFRVLDVMRYVSQQRAMGLEFFNVA